MARSFLLEGWSSMRCQRASRIRKVTTPVRESVGVGMGG